MSPLSGLSAFPVTPADADGRVDCDHLGRLVTKLAQDEISSIGVLGSTGGYMYLSAKERDRALRAAVEATGNTPVLAGIGDLRTSDVLTHVKSAESAGAAGLLLAPVSYLPLTDQDVTSLVHDVANATDLPVCFYNNPGTTKFTLSEELLQTFANSQAISAVKNPAPAGASFTEQLNRLRPDLPDNFVLGYSGDATIAGALEAGADTWYSVLAGTLPTVAIELWKSRKDIEALNTLNADLTPLWKTFNAYGSIRVIHEIANMIGIGPVNLPRPLLPLDKMACEKIERCLTIISAKVDIAA